MQYLVKVGRTASEEVTFTQIKMWSRVDIWFGMFLIIKEQSDF